MSDLQQLDGDDADDADEAALAELLRHNFEFDEWELLSDAEKERRIKWALRTS